MQPVLITQELIAFTHTHSHAYTTVQRTDVLRNSLHCITLQVNIAQVPAAPTIMSVYDREKQLDNVGLDGVVIFDILWKLNYTEIIKPYLDAGYKVVLNLEFVETFPNLNATATGRYDKWLYDFAWQVTHDGRPITIRPLHEFNGNWYNWGTYSGAGNSIESFKAAWMYVLLVL
jgi:Glycosyl hydrolase family 26